jgi:hypothetical protein
LQEIFCHRVESIGANHVRSLAIHPMNWLRTNCPVADLGG